MNDNDAPLSESPPRRDPCNKGTAIALIQFMAPSQVLHVIYGEAPTNVVCLTLARHWGLLVFRVGVLLIYVAFHPSVCGPAMALRATEKIALGAGVLGTPFA
jgi:hypothetical protein